MNYTSQEEHDHFEGAAEQSVPQKPMTNTEKRLADKENCAILKTYEKTIKKTPIRP